MRYFALANAVVVGLALFAIKAHAEDCPAGAKSCKILTLTPDEEALLVRQGGIFQTAAQARSLDLGSQVQYFVTKIEAAPAGVVKPEPPKPEPTKIDPPETKGKK